MIGRLPPTYSHANAYAILIFMISNKTNFIFLLPFCDTFSLCHTVVCDEKLFVTRFKNLSFTTHGTTLNKSETKITSLYIFLKVFMVFVTFGRYDNVSCVVLDTKP